MGYSPKNYADYGSMIEFVSGELADKKVKIVACGF
jgi:hypothetical protein